MTRKALDPALASILDSIRATVGGEASPTAEPQPDEEQAAASARPAGRPAAPARTVEDFLADLVRPQVDAWLQANLPEIVQKLAAEEIARLTDRK